MNKHWRDFVSSLYTHGDKQFYVDESDDSFWVKSITIEDKKGKRVHAISHLSSVVIANKKDLPWLDRLCDALFYYYKLGLKVRLNMSIDCPMLVKTGYIFRYLKNKNKNTPNAKWHLSEITKKTITFTVVDNSGLFRPWPLIKTPLVPVKFKVFNGGYKFARHEKLCKFGTLVERGARLEYKGMSIVF